jgi:hypothetical protein
MVVSSPPGMREGQRRAPSEPPDIPQPIQWIPCLSDCFWCDMVVSQWAFQKSQIASLGDRREKSSSATSVVTFPAGTRRIIFRGDWVFCMSSAIVEAFVTDSPMSAMSASTFSHDRFQTTMDLSCDTMFRTRFSPIVPSQISQRWVISGFFSTPSFLPNCEKSNKKRVPPWRDSFSWDRITNLSEYESCSCKLLYRGE